MINKVAQNLRSAAKDVHIIALLWYDGTYSKIPFSFLDGETFKKLYTSFVRPHLEYANPVWSSHLRKHIKMLESPQERATKSVDSMKNLDYTEKLELPTLQFRRQRGDTLWALITPPLILRRPH